MITFSKKNPKYFGALLSKFGQKGIFYKNWYPSIFSIYSPLTSCKKNKKKLISQLWKVLINERTNEQTDERTDRRTNELTQVKLH